jgi:hypothetical protein
MFLPRLLSTPLPLPARQAGKNPREPPVARFCGRWPEECHKDVAQSIRVDAPDHAPGVRNRDSAGLFGDHHGDGIAGLGYPQSRPVTQAYLTVRLSVQVPLDDSGSTQAFAALCC